MAFNIKKHKDIPEGFEFYHNTDYPSPNPHDTRSLDAERSITSKYYFADNPIKLYGMQGNITADLITRYEDNTRKWLGTKQGEMKEQKCYLTLFFPYTAEGYEQSASQANHPLNDDYAASGIDPEKRAAAKAIATALKAHFDEYFKTASQKDPIYQFAMQDTPNVGMTITIDIPLDPKQKNQDPFAGIEEVTDELKNIISAYERGEKPLGDLTEPTGQVMINPRLTEQDGAGFSGNRLINTSLDPESLNRWRNRHASQQTPHDRRMNKIGEMLEDHFPVGKTVTEEAQREFLKALSDYLSPGTGIG